MQNEFEKYQPEEKPNNCWYLEHCDKERCGADRFCPRHYKMSYLVSAALLEGKQRFTIPLYPEKIDFANFVRLKEIQKNIFEFVKEGKNLLIYSENTGNGKTEWSKKLLLTFLDSIWSTTDFECRAMFVSFPLLIPAMKDNISKSNDYFTYVSENIPTADLIVWDEINYKEMTSFEEEFLLSTISQRLTLGKSNIYTTNFSLPSIKEKLGPRLASRIVGASECIELKGSDKRHKGV